MRQPILHLYGKLGGDPKLLETAARTATGTVFDPASGKLIKRTTQRAASTFLAFSAAVTEKSAAGEPTARWIEVLDFRRRAEKLGKGGREQLVGELRIRSYHVNGQVRTKRHLILQDIFLKRPADDAATGRLTATATTPFALPTNEDVSVKVSASINANASISAGTRGSSHSPCRETPTLALSPTLTLTPQARHCYDPASVNATVNANANAATEVPMRICAMAMQKGGVGKTTVVVNTAAGLARRGLRVLLVDLDWQANATDALGRINHGTSGTYGVIVGESTPQEVLQPIEDGLDLLPSSPALATVDEWLTPRMRREEVFKRRMADVDNYDFILIDTGPSFNLVNINALTYATELWLTVSVEYFGLEGAAKMLRTANLIHEELGHELPIRHVIPNFADHTNKAAAALKALRGTFGDAVTPAIRRSVHLSEAPGHHKVIWDYASQSLGRRDFDRLIDHLVGD